MNLSQRASNYLSSLIRDSSWTSGIEETRLYLINQKISEYSEFLRYQLNFSGYELTIRNDTSGSFIASLFSQNQLRSNECLDVYNIDERQLIICGDHSTAQFPFYLSDRGEICTYPNEEYLNILYSSFDFIIEEYALLNEIYNWTSDPLYYKVLDGDKLYALMGNEFQIIDECSDIFTTWWRSGNLIAVKGVWLDMPDSYFHVYGKNMEVCMKFTSILKQESIVE